MSIKDELQLIPKNPLVWISRIKAKPFTIKLLMVIIAVEWVMDWYLPTFVDQTDRLLVTATGSSSPTGPLSLPFWLYRLTLFVLPLFAFSVWRSIWADHFNFPKINWYYYADFYVGCFFAVFFAVMALLSLNYVVPLAQPMNQLGISLIDLDQKVFAIVFIIALIQLASIPNPVYGLKSWFIGLGIAAKLLWLVGAPNLLQQFCAWGFSAVSLLLLVRILKGLQGKPAADGGNSPAVS